MDLYKTIRTLHEERERLDRLITSLEQLQADGPAEIRTRHRRGRKGMGAEERRQVSERMRKYWAGRRANPRPSASAAAAAQGSPSGSVEAAE